MIGDYSFTQVEFYFPYNFPILIMITYNLLTNPILTFSTLIV